MTKHIITRANSKNDRFSYCYHFLKLGVAIWFGNFKFVFFDGNKKSIFALIIALFDEATTAGKIDVQTNLKLITSKMWTLGLIKN